jgi:hypothetical protein
MTHNPDFKQQEIARHAFNLKRHLAGKGYPSPRETGTPFFPEAKEPAPREPDRVTDGVMRYRWKLDPASKRTPTREAHETLARHHKRVSLVVQNLLIWGAVAWMVWYLFV